MSSGGEFDDDRCPGGDDDDSRVSFGPGHIDDLTAVADEQVEDGALDLLVPGLDGRWPEPRALWQDEVFFLRDRTRVDVASLGPGTPGGCSGCWRRWLRSFTRSPRGTRR